MSSKNWDLIKSRRGTSAPLLSQPVAYIIPMSGTIFDVDESTNDLSFQEQPLVSDFSHATISADTAAPMGRISPGGAGTRSGGGGGGNDLYGNVEGSIGNSLSGATKSGGVLNLDFYTGYFDVDTVTVLTRCYKTLLPMEDYVAEVLGGVPDLYGPFWVPTTLIFSLFLTSSLTSSITAYLAGQPYTYDFTRLGAAVSLVYAYFLGLPILVWATLKYWAGVHERSAVEMISLYGYASTIWILISWLSLIPFGPLQLLLAFGATGLSLAFLVRNLYPVIQTSEKTSSKLLIVAISVLHLGLGIGLYWGFMSGGGSGALNSGAGTGVVPEPIVTPPVDGRW